MNKQELNKKLAEWAGCQPEKVFEHPGYYLKYPDFTQSLDACFKWLVPKLHNLLGDESMYDLMIMWVRDTIFGRDPALALCLAIEKLLMENQR